jgi:hypothetical protein
LRRRARSGLTLRAGVRAGKGLRHVLGPRTDGSARLSRTLQHVDEEYFELEFVVGFPAEEDMLR